MWSFGVLVSRDRNIEGFVGFLLKPLGRLHVLILGLTRDIDRNLYALGIVWIQKLKGFGVEP